MKKQFYHGIIEVDSLYVALDSLTLTDTQKEHLKHLIDSSLYHTVLDAILSELSDEDKKVFLDHLAEDDHTKTMEFLEKRIVHIEDKIKKAADDLMKELHADIQETKKR